MDSLTLFTWFNDHWKQNTGRDLSERKKEVFIGRCNGLTYQQISDNYFSGVLHVPVFQNRSQEFEQCFAELCQNVKTVFKVEPNETNFKEILEHIYSSRQTIADSDLSMNLQTAFDWFCDYYAAQTGNVLKEDEILALMSIWEEKSYEEITGNPHVSLYYIIQLVDSLLQKFKDVFGYKVTRNDLKSAIEREYRKEFPKDTMADSKVSTVNQSPNLANPFPPRRGVIDNPELRYFRTQQIERIFELLNSGSSVSLIGQEGMGKSSLLLEICRQAPSKLTSSRIPIYLDLSVIDDDAHFYSELCDSLKIEGKTKRDLNRALKDQRVLLAIDNVEKMTWEGFTFSLRSFLRGNAERSNAPLKLVLASRNPLSSVFEDNQKTMTSPLAGICIEEILALWSEETVRDFIAARLQNTGISFSEAEINQLKIATNGHPKKLMIHCRELYDQKLTK
jgi:hypothetical protein